MSSRVPFAANKGLMVALVIAALAPMGMYAANPNIPAKKEDPKAPAPILPASQPKPPAVRSPASFTRQMPFGETIDLLRNSTTPPLNIIVLWKPLGDNAGVYRDTPIGIDAAAGLRVNQYLELLMLSLSAGASAKLGYAVDKGVITISTTDALPAPKPVIRVYDISDLVAPPARYSLPSMGFGMGYGGPTGTLGGYAGSPGPGAYSRNPASGLSNPMGGTYRRIVPSPRTYRNR